MIVGECRFEKSILTNEIIFYKENVVNPVSLGEHLIGLDPDFEWQEIKRIPFSKAFDPIELIDLREYFRFSQNEYNNLIEKISEFLLSSVDFDAEYDSIMKEIGLSSKTQCYAVTKAVLISILEKIKDKENLDYVRVLNYYSDIEKKIPGLSRKSIHSNISSVPRKIKSLEEIPLSLIHIFSENIVNYNGDVTSVDAEDFVRAMAFHLFDLYKVKEERAKDPIKVIGVSEMRY